jgi:tetratricopeptide (TPR) repeat protein
MRPVTCRRLSRRALLAPLAAVFALLPVAVAVAADPTREELSDLEAKAQYAFFTGDMNALRGLAKSSRTLAESEQPLVLYHYAHVQFRLLQVASLSRAKKEADAAGEACVAALDRAVDKDPRFAEGLALQSNCYGYLASLGPLNAMTAGPRAASRAEAAAKLNPRNPRVLLSEAASLYLRPAAFGGDRAAAAPLFRRAAEAFDTLDAPRPGEPTWGAAEAWLFVGRTYEDAGDVLAARDAYEKALLIAPEFARARERRAGLTR